MKRVDPTEWANKKKAQLERAKQLREERKNQIGSNDTFSPQINPPRRMANGGGNRGDSLDNLTHEVTASRPIADDIMEQPLPGQRNRQQQQDTGFDGAPSPGSDTLGKELRRYGGAPSNPSSDTQPRNLNSTHFKSKFMQQYDQPVPQLSPPHQNSFKQNQQNQQNQPDNDEIFMNQLRGGDKYSNGPGWNDDTSFGGFDSNSNNTRRAAPARTKPVRPSVHRTQQNDDHDDYNNSGATWNNSDQPAAPPRNRMASGVQTKLTPRTAGEVRSTLSLLKSKIRQSESAGKATGSFGGQGRTSLAGSGGFEPEEEFQTSMGARQRQNDASGSSKASFGTASHTNSNVSFISYASGYDDQPEESLVPRNRATRPRPRGIASDQQGSFSRPAENEEDTYSNNYSSRNVPPVSSKSQPQNSRQQIQSNEQKGATAGYEPSVGTGRGLSGHNNGRNTNYGGNNGPSSTSIDDVPAVASRSNNTNFPPNAFPPSSMGPSEEDDAGGPQMECPTCGRHFNPISFPKHVRICEKVFVNKRKAFDSTKMRVQDNPELVKILTMSKKEKDKAARKAAAMANGRNSAVQNEEENFMVSKPKQKMSVPQEQPVGGAAQPLWKQQSNAFREAMKAARAVTKAMETGAPLPAAIPSGPDPSLIPCPHCGRRFNAKAADRHIPQCQNIKAKPTSLKRGSGINASTGAGVLPAKGRGRF